jgi:hypothetical protein
MRLFIADYLCIATLSLIVLKSPLAHGQDSAIPDNAPTVQATELSSTAGEPARGSAPVIPPKIVVPFAQEAYRVVVEIGFNGQATEDPLLRQRYVDQIRKGLDRMYGAAWAAEVHQSEWLIPGGKERLLRLTTDELLTRYPESAAQKVLLIGLEESIGTYQISCREFDTRVQEMSPVLTAETSEEQDVANAACRLARDSFRPVLLVAGPAAVDGELEFLLQAGELAVPDPTAG